MILEVLRFILVAFFLIAGLVCFVSAVTGAWKFGFVMNRMHAAGIGDTLGLLCVIVSMAIYSGLGMGLLKLIVIAVFLWLTSPVSSHFLSQIEYYTNPSLYSHVAREVELDELSAAGGAADLSSPDQGQEIEPDVVSAAAGAADPGQTT